MFGTLPLVCDPGYPSVVMSYKMELQSFTRYTIWRVFAGRSHACDVYEIFRFPDDHMKVFSFCTDKLTNLREYWNNSENV